MATFAKKTSNDALYELTKMSYPMDPTTLQVSPLAHFAEPHQNTHLQLKTERALHKIA
jgi:hypothetical protein